MRKFTSILGVFTLLLFSIATLAQSVLVVEPGIGTLNAAITANGGNKIYQLKAEGWYQLNAIIEHKGYHLQIIGEKPAAGKLPATLQTNGNAEGVVFNRMFNAFGNLTIKGVYVMNIDLLGVKGGMFLAQNDTLARVVIDNCILEPVSNGSAIQLDGGNNRVYFTNNQVFNMGHQLSPNDGHFFNVGTKKGVGVDTLYVENNTFVCMGTNMFSSDFNKVVNGYVKFNHNTWVMQKSQFDWSCWEKTYIFSNNLMFDAQTQPWAVTWQPMPGADKGQPLPALVYADTIPGEVLPSTRQQFWEYNMHYRNPKFYTQLVLLNDSAVKNGKAKMYYMPLMWSKDSLKSREAQLFANDVAFPNWKAGNNTENVDPQWEDPKIYEHSDKFVEWTKNASLQHALGLPATSYPPASQWTQYHWNPDGDYTINNTWPIFNGKYKNATLLKASIENLPLGDLNWFPESKAKWMADKAAIDAHIHAGNEGKFTLTSAKSVINNDPSFVNIFPNPVSNQLKLSKVADVVTISDITGRQLKKLTNTDVVSVKEFNDGIYFVSYKIGTVSGTQKVIVQK